MFNKLFPKISKIWLVVWIFFYSLILGLSIALPTSIILNVIKVLSILGCLVYACINYPQDDNLKMAMLITLIADGLLAFHDNLFYGVFAFFIAQLLHFYRLTNKYTIVMIYGSIALICIFLSKIINIEAIDPMFILCGFYALAIIANITTSIKWRQQNHNNPHALSASLGFPLFLACDTCVATSYLSTIGILPASLTIMLNFLAWFFYYPSQILVSNSTKCATID